MRSKDILFLIILIFISFSALGQEEIRNKSRAAYVEIFGNGLTYSLNYDARFGKAFDGLGFKAGVSYIAIDGQAVATIPFGLNYLLGKNGKYLELGAGGTYGIGYDSTNTFQVNDDRNTEDQWFGTLTFGYRREPKEGGFLFRVALTPIITQGVFWPFYGGVSFGYAF